MALRIGGPWLIFLAMRPPDFSPSILRLSGRPRPDDDAAAPMAAPRPRGSRRPHADRTVAAVRALIEETTLTYGQIAARTGASPACISRWMRDGAWKRPPFAPRATDTVPTARASAFLKRRMLGLRLTALAERYVRELEETPTIDLARLGEALALLKMANLAAMRRTPRRTAAALWSEPMRPIAELCAAGVDLSRAPRAAVEDFLAHRATPPEDEKPPRSRGLGRPRMRAQLRRWMMERE
jgi:hypothetical protein